MTTTVIVKPHGHNIEVLVTYLEGGLLKQSTEHPDPHGEHHYAVYDDRTITVRELEGWAPMPFVEPGAR